MKKFNHYPQKGIYRSRNGVIFGVCRGLAESFDFSVFWVRMIWVILLLLTGLWPILGIYLVLALMMKPEPAKPIQSEEEQEFYDTYVHSRQQAVRRIKRRYEQLERRIRRMEDKVTGRDFEWEDKLNRRA